MTVMHTSKARRIGDYFGGLLSGIEGAKGLWALQEDGQVELWLVVDADNMDAEREFHSLLGRVLAAFPESTIDLRVVNAHRVGEHNAFTAVPGDAIKIEI